MADIERISPGTPGSPVLRRQTVELADLDTTGASENDVITLTSGVWTPGTAAAGSSVDAGAIADVGASGLYLATDAGQMIMPAEAAPNYWAGIYPHGGVPQSGWTFDNQDSATQKTGSGRWGHTKFGAGSSTAWTWQYRTAPTPPYAITMRVCVYIYTRAGNEGWAFGFRDSAGKFVALHQGNSYVASSKFSSANATAGDYVVLTTWDPWMTSTYNHPLSRFYVKLQDDNTNLIVSLSPDGFMWHQADSRARGDYLGTINGVAFGTRGNTVGISIEGWTQS